MIVLLLTCKNEADLLAWNLAHHLNYGVDHVAVADNCSDDSTQDVIAEFGEHVSSIVFDDFHERQAVRTQLLDRIRERHRVDWVGVSDVDEFWFAPAASLRDLLAGIPAEIVAANFDSLLFLPTALDGDDGPVFVRRTYCTTADSPLHTSYAAGKTFYRGDWLTNVTDEHLGPEVPHPRYRHAAKAVHHYMVQDEDQFVAKVSRLIAWAPPAKQPGRFFKRAAVDPRTRELPAWSASFKKAWWRVYCEGGEPAVRRYYREQYTLPADAVDANLRTGALGREPAFSDYAARAVRRRSA